MHDLSCIFEEKEKLRLHMKTVRGALCHPADSEAGARIVRRVTDLLESLGPIPESAVVALFYPIRMEADLFSHAGDLRTRGIRIALPRVFGDTLIFSEVGEDTGLAAGVFGIMEPLPGAGVIPVEEIHAICVPGLAFDHRGGRIGYGKGYYDHFLGAAKDGERPVLIGVGYDFQLVDRIPQCPGDIRMDYIVTPSGTRKTAGEFDTSSRQGG